MICLDHVIPYALAGTNGDRNLATSCKRCNAAKGARSPTDAGMRWPEGLGEAYVDGIPTIVNGVLTGGGHPHDTEGELEREKEGKGNGAKPARAHGALPALDPRPAWLPVEWEDFEQHRSVVGRKTWTELARRKALGQLEKWLAEGYDLSAVINASIASGWSGLFARREHKKPTKGLSAKSRAAVDAFVRKGDDARH